MNFEAVYRGFWSECQETCFTRVALSIGVLIFRGSLFLPFVGIFENDPKPTFGQFSQFSKRRCGPISKQF